MSYQKSVALLSCCLLFSMSFVNLALASVTGTPSGIASDGPKVTLESTGSDSGAELNPALFSALPPDTEGPTLTITPANDVNLTGCWSDFTYSIAAMGKPDYTAYDECGTATVTETVTDTYVYCSLPDTLVNDGTPEGGLTILREFAYVAVDCFGNETSDAVVQTITVSDAVAPTFVEALPADTTVDCAAIPTAPTLTATDDCDSEAQVVFLEFSTTTCAGITRMWIAVDDCGNETTHTQFITVTDTENPVISDTPSDINQTADAGDCGALVTWTAPTATDNCTLDTFTSTHNSGDFFDVGTTTVTYTAMDDCGNSTSTSFDITITDDEDPTLSGIPGDMTQTADAGQCGAVVTWPAASDMPAPSAADNCSATLTSTHDSGDTFAVGTTTVTYTATDPSGNTVSESFTVTITDDEAPTIGLVYAENFENETPADANDLCLAGSEYTPADANWTLGPACLVPTNGIPRLVDDGGDTFLEFNQKYPANSEVWNSADMDVSGLDQVTISFDARSIGGLESYGPWVDDFALYAVIDGTEQATPLVAFSGHVDGTGESPGDNSRSEEASFTETLSLSGASGLSLRIRVTISGTDGSETYQVNDFLVSSNPTDMTQTADAGNCSAVVTWVAPEAADNCAVTSFTSTHNSGDAFAVGTTTVIYTAMDEAGNTTTHSFDIVVTDDEDPTISGTPADITQTADAGGCNAAVSWTAPTSDDNCAIATLTSTHNPGDTFDVGTTAVTYTATDVHGNTTTSTFNVTVTDDENPVITGLPANITVSNDEGDCGADVYWTEISNPDATDNCSIDTFSSDYSSGAFFTVGTTTVTYTAIDIHGNSSTASFTVTVTDAEAPSITDMPSNLSVDTDAGQCAAVVTWDAPTFGDNCNVATTGSNYSSGESFGPGTTTVTYTATDDAGNTATSSFTVTVTDNEAPTIANTPADVSVTNDAGICGASVTWAAPTPNDNCSIQNFTSSHDSGSIFAVGTTAVTFTATDTNGNTTTSTFDITVTDTEDPTFSGMPANITQTADAGNCSAEVDWTAPTADDNCAVQSLTSDHDPMDDFPVGTTTVTYTATDIHGNSATSSFTITVTDDEAPTISDIPSDITQTADAGQCGAVVTWPAASDMPAPSADDNCPGTSLTATHNSGDTFAVGTTTVTYTAEDAAGNQTTSSFTVTVTDDEAPVIGNLYSEDFENETPVDASNLCLPGNIYTPDDANWSIGEACLVPTNGIPQLTDVAGDTHLHFNQKYPANSEVWNSATMDVAAYSEVQVSFDARSVGGLENSGPYLDDFAIYAVLDGVEQGTPIVAFNGHVDGSGNPPSSNSVTQEASFSETVATNGASGLALRIRVMISGGDGSESYQVDDFMVNYVPGDLSASNDAGDCSAAVTWTAPLASENCSATLTSTHNPGDSFAVGTTTVTYTATDPASNTATLSFDVVVSDDEDPAIPQMDDITVSTDDGLCTADVTWSDPAATDNCGVTSLVASPASGSTFALGTNAVTYTAMDEAGNTTTMTFNVIVEDNENPEILDSEGATFVTTDLTQDTDDGLCTAVVTWTSPVGSDNCTLASLTSTHNPGDTFDKGTTTVTYTAEDNSGNTTTVSFDVVVSDNEAPTITDMPINQSVSTDAGECSAVVTWDAPTIGDNCGVATSGANYSSGESFGPGTATVTYTATDDAGNQTTASFTVTVTDNEAPTIAGMPADTTLSNDPGVCGANVLWDNPTPDDNCSIQTFTSSHDNGSIYPVGSTVVTYTAADTQGNTTTATFTITVTDDEAPAIPQMDDITVSTEAGICTADVTWSDPAATDNCTVTSLSSDIASGTTFSLGTTAVTYTATDPAGNSTTMTFDVIVEDNEAPTITEAACNMQVECDGAGNSAALMAWLTDNAGATATDNCSAVTWSNDFTTMANTCGGAGAVQVVFTATDEAGNTSTSTATFTIVDTTAPTITLGASDSTVECDGSGNTTQFNAWLANYGGATASESCSSVIWSNDYLGDDGEGGTNDFSDGCGATGSVTITFTATDVCGNASNTSATFTIEDTTNPTAVAQNHTVLLDASGNGTMVAGDIDNGSSDGCSSVTLSASQTSFTCSDLGANTITLTVTDACSNASTATATVTVKDEVAPNITVAAADTTFECNGTDYSAQFAAWLADNGGADATDACGPLTWTNNSTGLVPGCGDSESEEVTFTVTDGSGNTSSTTATFSVIDTAPPTIASEAIDITLECNGTGNTVELNAWLLANGGAGAATDLCGDVTWSHNFDDYALTCAGTGAVEVIFSATDDCGNAATTTAMFEIVDTTAPTLTLAASDSTVECGSSNAADLSAWLANNGGATADELCGNVTWTNDYTALSDDCGNTGSASVTFTASDDCGNSATTTATFTIEDTTSPTALGSDLTVTLDGNGQATITADDIDNGSSDACGEVTLSIDVTSFDCDDVGPNDVVLTVTDECMNAASATVTVIVTAVDDAAPTISDVPADITQTADAGVCGAVVTYESPLTADNCDGGTLTSSHPSGSTFPVGTTMVTFTATDASGNSSTDSFTITVTDDEAPSFSGPAPASAENYALGPISDSDNSTIQEGWTGGAQAYFQNDATDDETVTDAEANSGSNSWFYTDAYNNPGQGSPHAPSLGLPSGTGPGTTFTLEFYFKAEATADGDGSVHRIYQGTYAGDDRTGFNINIKNAADASGEGGLHIFTYSYDAGSFPVTTIASNLDRNVWHKVNVTYTIDASGDPNLDTAEYSVDDGASVSANTWMNTWRVDQGFTQAYGDNIAWAGSGNSSGFYYDDITYSSDFDGSSKTIGFETAQPGPAFADITLSNDAGNCSAIATWSEPTTTDNCAVASVTSTHDSGDTFAVGTTTVTYTAEDAAGNQTTMSFDVVVTDNENPVIAGTPADITQTAEAGTCGAAVSWTAATATDNCGVASISPDYTSGDTFPVGTTTVTYTATDIHGNTTTSTFDITVTDDEDPTLYNVPADITQTADAGQCGAVVEWEYYDALTDSDVYPYANDNCGMASFVLSHNDGDTFPVGTTTVTITATDIHGNISTDSFDVTITDDEAPVIADTPADISQTNDAGNCSAVVTWTEPTDSDNCAIATFTSTHNPGDTFAVGTTTVTYTATDIHSNVTTSSFTVTVTDDEAPVISDTPADITQDNDLGDCSAVVTWVEPTADDNCDIDTFTSTHNPGDTFAVGTTTVTYTATDIHSNVTTSSFDITVEDAENPVITTAASDLTVECDGAGNLTELNTWLTNHGGSEASDNCAVTSITNDYDVANMSDECGLTGSILVTFTHTDAAGNSATSSATFTIEDTTAPTFTPQGGSEVVECDGEGNVAEIDAWLAIWQTGMTVTDDCGGVSITKTTTLLSDECAATGEASITWTAVDDCGNTNDTTLTFTIVDTMGPVFLTTADDLTVECDGAGNTAALQAWLDNHGGATAEDVCGDFTWSNDFDALSDDCGATGSRTVTFTATDECGNESYTSATFTIEDTTAPTIASEAMDMTVECDGLGNTAALNSWLAANGNAGAASDICGGVTWSNDFTALSDDCGATGSATVIFTATDDCGSATSTTATFTIEDTTAPSLDMAAADMTVECDGSGNVAELNNWLTTNAGAAASDQCSGVTWSNDFTALSDLCGATGAATVTFTATDDCGLTVSTTATFTIEDTTAPSMDVEAADLTVECDGAGNPTELNDWLTSNGGASASDECSGVTWSNDFTALSDLCGATGAATVTFTATDDCGLSTSTTATFTIEDMTAPVLSGDEIVIIDCSAWPWDPLYQPTIDELLTVVDTAGNPMITLDEACGYTNFPIDFGVMSGGCNYDHQLIYYPVDDCGNEGDSLYQVIQVDDFTDPTFLTVPADTMIACTENVMAYLEMATAEDACDPSVNMTFEDEVLPSACPEEYTIRRTFYAEDCGYNIAEAVQLITVADTAAPALALTAPADMAVNGCLSSADLSEAAMGSVTWTTSDDCGDVTVTYTTSDANAFSCTGDDDADEGSYVVTRTFTVTATDCAGNSTTESIDQTITITDDTAPTVSLDAPADETVYLDASCYAAPLATPVSGDATGFLVTATDNCDSDVAHTIAVSDDTTYTGVVDGVGSYEILRTYTVTVTDDCENEATATTSHTISVLDEIDPDVTADFPADIIIYADDDNGYFDPTPLSTGAASADYSDNCSGSGDQTYGVAGQVPTGGLIITAIGDPNDDWQTCRFVEIHNSGDSDIDLTGYALQRWTNGNAGPSTGSNIDLSSIGTMAPGQYAWIANNAGFADCYGFTATITAGTGGPADSNGDDQIAIIDGASNIIDMFGVAGEDGSNTCHEFEDGIALRAGSNTDPNGGAWDESGWIVYSDGSSASGCTNHNSGQPQNASDIALLINNWAGAGPAAPETDFNSVDISYADETTSYTASACYTFERTWTITVTDNNGNATTVTDVQTIQVADTSAPDITALENTVASCDLFGFDLSAGDESILLAGTSFEEGTSGDQYVDTGDATVDHALANNPGQSDVNFTSTGGEMGFSSYYYATGSSGLTDGDFVGVTSFTGVVGAFTDGSQGFQMQDTDGIMEVVFDNVDVSMGGVTLTLDYFPQSTGWETADRIRIWVVADGGEIDLVDTEGEDIDNLGIEGQWNLASLDLDGFDDVELHISLQSNSGSEGLFIDNIAFSTGNSPLAALEANGFVSFSDNVELASTEAAITLDGTPCEGAYDIVYTATDSCGNTTTSSQRIVLEDTVDPILTVETPEAVTLYTDADCFADYVDGVPYPAASATDNCDEDVEITSSHFDGTKQYTCLPGTGAFSVTRTYVFTATDNCGNTTETTVTRLVTVVDNTAPTFTAAAPADKTVNIDPFCGANTSTTIAGMPTVTDVADNCDSNVDIDIDYADSAPVYTCSGEDGAAEGSYTFERTFTITGTDDCGNETVQTVTQTITALDVTAPTITALPPMAAANYTLDGDCMADLTPAAEPVATATDACDSEVAITSTYSDGAPTYTCDGADGEAEGSFSFTRTWTVTATDDCGNSTSQITTQTVVVTDEGAPSIDATWPADYTTDLDADCNADLTPAAAGAATATGEDACDSDVTVEISSEDGAITYMAVNIDDVAEGGYFFTRTWTVTATDDCGNSTTETHDQLITANDVTAPTQVLETLPTYSVEGCYGEVDLDPSVTGTPTVDAEDGCDSQLDIDLTYSTDDLVFNEVVGDYSLVIDTISGPEDGVLGMTTVRLYIETENEDDFVSAVAGDEINPTGIRTTTSFYQNVFGSSTANTYNDGLTVADPLVAYDSWVTIGIDQQPDGGAGEGETTIVGDWANSFEAGGDILISDFFGGSWFTTSPNTAAVAGSDHRVLLGQFTTDGQMSGQMFVQVFPNGLGSEEMRISFTFGDCAEDDDTPEGSYAFTRRWESVVTDDADNASTAVTYQHIQVLDTEAPQLTNTCGLDNGETVANDCPGIGVLDFDPVPVACDVTAIDNCDSEVNVTLFTETEGYIPTDDIRNYCAPMTPEAQDGAQTCDDRAPEALRLFNFPGADDTFVMAEGENLVQVMSDGSMHIELEVENADGTGGFLFTADYGAGADWATWSAGGSNYKKDCADIYPGEAIWEEWVYFLMTAGTLEGTGMYAGSSFTLSHQPANGYYGMQMGLGANNKNTNYGGSAWFFWQGNLVVDGTDMGPMASSGDVYMDLDCCLEWSVDYHYTAIDDCGNPTGFHYTESMGADLEDGDATVSGGHTVGPVDITSVGGIKEPIRITGLAPNPTNDMSQLSFVVSENMRLRVDLYTMSGTLVQELYEGNAVTGVQYVMDIDADALSDGMYQVRISSNSYLAVKKLLVAN